MVIIPKFPTEEEWQNVIDRSDEIRNLSLFACFGKENRELINSVEHFNDKLNKLRISYYFVQYYYGRPGAGDLFEYYVENFYIRLFSLWDFIYHLINEFYQFWVNTEGGRAFKGDVKRRLHKTDRRLSNYLNKAEQENKDFVLARKYRNSIVHQIFPGDGSVELTRLEWNGKLQKEIKKPVSPEEFMNNIRAVIRLLGTTLDLLEKEFSEAGCKLPPQL